MTTAHPSDPTAPSYADLLAQNARLQQQLDAQKQHYQQQAAQLKQQYQQQMDAQRQQYEAKLARINQALIDAIAKQQRLIHRLFGQKSEGLTPKQDHLNKETALEDLALLEQAHDNFLAKLSDDERAKLPASKPINTHNDSTDIQSKKPTQPKRQKRIVIPDNLDIHTIIHEPPSTTCDCACQMTQIGQDIQDKLGFKPKQFYRERHVYPKYTCRNAACNRERLVQVKTDAQIIDKSIATPALLAHILISKYADHLPLYRQSLIYQRSGVYLSDSTLADWVGRCGVQLGFLANRLRQMILTQPILHADETPVKVLNGYGMKDAKGKLKQGYVWAYVTPQHSEGFGGFNAVVYDFAQGRGSEYPNTFLQGFKGKLVCDSYNGYKPLFGRGVIEVGCMAHARRKFHELHVTGQSLISIEALELFQALYAVEREIDERFEKNQSPMPRDAQIVRQVRQNKAKPVADKLYAWLQQKRLGTTKNAAITKAIEYCLKRWTALTRYLDDGNLPIDMRSTASQGAENQMRPWALGRKNWLFAGSLESGKRAANVMSLIQSARLNGLDPYAYLADVLRRLPTHPDSQIDELLPHVWKPSQ